MSKPPKVTFRKNEPMQHYYCDGLGGWYSVARLIDDSKDLPVFECPLASLDLSGEIWRGENILGLVTHVRRCMDADLDKPILLDWHGSVADGRHRIIKALALGKRTIKARRMTWKPEPCKKDDPA